MNLIIFSLIFIFVSGCKKSADIIVPPQEEIDIIQNFSFEVDGLPSIEGWSLLTNVSSSISYSADVPPSGGSWSVVLSVGDRVLVRLRSSVSPPQGLHTYRLSVWAKSKGEPGKVRLLLNETELRTLIVTDSIWKFYSTLDTITTTPSDSLVVELDAGITSGFSQSFFDLCRLTIIK